MEYSDEDEVRLSLKQAAHHPSFRREDGSAPDESTLFRWAFKGVRGVKLRVTRVGGRIFTTDTAITEFLARLNSSAPNAHTSP